MKLSRIDNRVDLRQRLTTGAVGAMAMGYSGFVTVTAMLEHDFRTAGLFACVFGIGLIAFLIAIRPRNAPMPKLLEPFDDSADSD